MMGYDCIKPGQLLWTKTNETVEVFAISGDSLTLSYKGKLLTRPKSVLGEKLFLKELITKPVDTPNAYSNNFDGTKECSDCMNNRSEKCYGSKTICSDFKYTGAISNTDRELWPEYGDASYMRMKRHSRNK